MTNSESKWIVLCLANILQALFITYLMVSLAKSNIARDFVSTVCVIL